MCITKKKQKQKQSRKQIGMLICFSKYTNEWTSKYDCKCTLYLENCVSRLKKHPQMAIIIWTSFTFVNANILGVGFHLWNDI